MSADTTGPKSAKPKGKPRGAPFQKGVSGNPAGRPKGSRNKLSEDYISALAQRFEEQGMDAIDRVIEENPAQFLKYVAELVPRDMQLTHNAGDAFVALWQSLASKTDEA